MRRRLLCSSTLATISAVLCFTSISATGQVEFQGLEDLPGGFLGSSAEGVSVNGRFVVGRVSSSAFAFGEAFIWSREGGFQPLGTLSGGSSSTATAVSNDGRVAVGWSTSGVGRRPFRWSEDDGMVDLGGINPDPGANDGRALGVSADGSITVGETRAREFVDNVRFHEAFIHSPATGIQPLATLDESTFRSVATAISAGGETVVGSRGGQGFLWTRSGGFQDLGSFSDGSFLSPNAVSRDGAVVVGNARRPLGRRAQEAFLWSRSRGLFGLGDLRGAELSGSFRNFFSIANGVSGEGSVVVGAGTAGDGQRAAIWSETLGMQRIDEVLREHRVDSAEGWVLTEAVGISEDGRTIAGNGINPDGSFEAWIATLPQPVTIDIRRGGPTHPSPPGARTHRVVLFASDHFDPSQVDVDSLRFGPSSGRVAQDPPPRLRNARRSSRARLIVHFLATDSSVGLGQATACLRGTSADGTPFRGCAHVPSSSRGSR